MPRQPGATGPDIGLRLPKIVVYCIDEHRTIVRVKILSTETGILNFQESQFEFLWWFLVWFWVLLPVCFDGGFFCLVVGFFVCIFVLFGFSLVCFFHSFFSLKNKFHCLLHIPLVEYALSAQHTNGCNVVASADCRFPDSTCFS